MYSKAAVNHGALTFTTSPRQSLNELLPVSVSWCACVVTGGGALQLFTSFRRGVCHDAAARFIHMNDHSARQSGKDSQVDRMFCGKTTADSSAS